MFKRKPKPLKLMPCAERIANGEPPSEVIHPGGYSKAQWREMGYDPECGCLERNLEARVRSRLADREQTKDDGFWSIIRRAERIIGNGKIHQAERDEVKRNCEIRRRLNAARECTHRGLGDAKACPQCGVPVETLYMMTMLDQFQEMLALMRFGQ